MSLRVVQVMGFSSGGVARHVATISDALQEHGDEVLVAAPLATHAQLKNMNPEIQTTAVEILNRPRLGDIAAMSQLRKLAKSADIVHAHGLRAGSLAVLATKGLKRAKVIVTLHNLPVGSRSTLFISRQLERVVSRGADAVLGVSLDLVEIAQSMGAKRTERALVSAPQRPQTSGSPNEARKLFSNSNEEVIVLTVARLAPQKGLETLCAAAELLVQKGVRFRWFIAGDGPLQDELQRRISDTKIPVVLLGRREDIADLIVGSDIFVNTSLWEGQPLSIQEALSLGAAIIATNVGGTPEVTSEAAKLVPVSDSVALSEAVVELFASQETRSRYKEAAVIRSRELPTEDDVIEQLNRIYTKVK